MSATLVSMFANVTAKKNEPIEIHAALDNIRNGKWREQVEKVRAAFASGGKEAARPIKKKLLPAVTFAGLFPGPHTAETLQQYSGKFILDFDALNGRLDEVRDQLARDPHCSALFRSPSGNGLKLLIKISSDAAEHKRAFVAVAAYFKKTYDLNADESGKDICRLCFVSDDPELIYNPDAAVFEIPPAKKSKPRPTPAQGFDDHPDREKVEDALCHISANCPYDDWLHIGMAINSWNPTDEGRAIPVDPRVRVKAQITFGNSERHTR